MTRGRHAAWLLGGLIVAGAFFATEAWAAGEHAPRWGDFGWRVLNLALFVMILWYFLGGLTRRFFSARRQNIQGTLDDLEQRRARAREHLAAIEKRIANLDAEREAILLESRQQAQNLKQNILDEARRQAEQIVEQARRAAENEGRAALDNLRATIADEIVEAAEKALKGRLTAADHSRLIANSLDKVVLH